MRIFADTALLADIERLNEHPWVSGFTTNPTIFKQAGVTDPEAHAKEILTLTDKPVSIDGPLERVWGLGPNAIPKVVGALTPNLNRPPLNHTAICTPAQLANEYRSDDIVSIFAGRIMDTGRSPNKLISLARLTGAQVLWASTRELYHIRMAEIAGCDIITIPPAMIDKLADWWDAPLESVAERTIAQFAADRIPW